MIKITGISGKRGSGKSLLSTKLGIYGYRRVSLAGLLKNRCKADFGLTDEQVNGDLKEIPTQYKRTDGQPLTPRDIMIRCGVYYRSIDPLYWCKNLADSLRYLEGEKFVIDDIRFINEIKFFKENFNAKFVRLERSAELNPFKAALDDLSETELDSYKDWEGLLLPAFNRNEKDLEIFADYLSIHL